MKTPHPSTSSRREPTRDSGYKLLYSHVAMVRDLLRGFLPGAWVHKLDFDTLERCSGSYVTDDLRDRADDLVWRLRWGSDWLYVYLLLEFQSTIDPWMAVRVQTYLGLLYQDLIRAETLSAAGRLPPVLPVVLYNGSAPWTAADRLEPLIEQAPRVLATYRPRQAYLLLDEQRLARAGQLPERNLCAALFRLEASRGADEVMGIVQALVDWLEAPEQTGLRRAFAVWFGRVFLPKRLPGVQLPSLVDLSEVYHMLAENLETWTDQWKREGLEQGLEKGLEQGREAARHILARQARRRFGATIAEQTRPLLARITDLQRLEELADQLLISADGDDWLQAVRSASAGNEQ
ncbi:Rpn family recombination-promoting nuclease/putative transposase [Thiorhodococcus minor]|uniref:Transposase n=1 Tax=Thiorhodococcus minor TaxID=57489 RepID=A0A6M0K1P7_9GAMM|nr:Rpn family recombination-promoting nuclease/putative transposase [Thiorhodococcus minor]NEV63254.1 transposase [Thiorhodococcus minor]